MIFFIKLFQGVVGLPGRAGLCLSAQHTFTSCDHLQAANRRAQRRNSNVALDVAGDRKWCHCLWGEGHACSLLETWSRRGKTVAEVAVKAEGAKERCLKSPFRLALKT